MNEPFALVTGGAGFVGSHLVRALVQRGERVVSLDDYSFGRGERHSDGATYVRGNTSDIERLIPETPTIVYHLGEYARAEQSFHEPEFVLRQNMLGTLAVLEYCRKLGVKLVYAASSSKFADEGQGRQQSPYSWSKAANADLIARYGEWYSLKFAITYFYNVYGPGENDRGDYATVIGKFLRLAKEGRPLTIRSPGTQRRQFTHIDDIISGVLLVGDAGVGDGYHLTSNESFSVLEVAELIGGRIEWLPERPGNRQTAPMVSSNSALRLGWEPVRSLESYLQWSLYGSVRKPSLKA